MKARVKATGEVIEVIRRIIQGRDYLEYVWYYRTDDRYFKEYELEFATNDIQDELDYWEKLKHQYAGAVMQGIMSNKEMFDTVAEGVWPPDRPAYIAARCDEYATALVDRLKKENYGIDKEL